MPGSRQDADGGGTPQPRLTNRTLFVLAAINLIDSINWNLLTPYVDEMVSDFMGLAPEDPRVADVVGLFVGLYSICEVFCCVLWGAFADRYGRRPALLIGLAGSAVAPIIFGLGKSLPVVFVARALDGIFCGNVGVAQTCLGELVDETNEAWAFGMLGLSFSLGLVIGPLLGGQLVHPASFAPSVFGGTVFETSPYLLPNLTYATFAAIVWVMGVLFLEESLPRSASVLTDQDELVLPGPGSNFEPKKEKASGRPIAISSRCFTPNLSVLIMTYCAVSGCFNATSQLFILMASYSVQTGGFGFGPAQIGFVRNSGALGQIVSQFLVYPELCKNYGPYRVFWVAWFTFVAVWGIFPLYALFADTSRFGDSWRYIALSFLQVFSSAATGMVFPTTFALINRASHGMEKGTVYGIVNSVGAMTRGIYPPLFSMFLGWASQPGRPDGMYLPLHTLLLSSTAVVVGGSRSLREVSRLAVQREESAASQAVDLSEANTYGTCGNGLSLAHAASTATDIEASAASTALAALSSPEGAVTHRSTTNRTRLQWDSSDGSVPRT